MVCCVIKTHAWYEGCVFVSTSECLMPAESVIVQIPSLPRLLGLFVFAEMLHAWFKVVWSMNVLLCVAEVTFNSGAFFSASRLVALERHHCENSGHTVMWGIWIYFQDIKMSGEGMINTVWRANIFLLKMWRNKYNWKIFPHYYYFISSLNS